MSDAHPRARYDAVFASDVHLSSAHPATTAAFLRFVDARVAGQTTRFFVLGDLFEYWAGDDDRDDPLGARIAARFAALAADGIDVAFLAGNRDFLVGDAFAAEARMRVLADPHAERIGGVDVVLSHGDAYCTDDVDYQRFRAMVRDPAWQRDFLGKPLAVRRAMVEAARRESESAKGGKAMSIMDVDAAAIAALLAAHPDAILVHGHTHRPAHHRVTVDAAARERWVLPDWDADAVPPRGGGLAIANGRIVPVPLA